MTEFEIQFLKGGIEAGAVQAINKQGETLPVEVALRAAETAKMKRGGIFSGDIQFII